MIAGLLRSAAQRGGQRALLHDAEGAVLFLEQFLQARAQGFALAQVDPALQRLKHSFHGPLLPLLEGDPVDLELAAYFRRFALLGPDGQHGLGFLGGRVTGTGLPFARRCFARRGRLGVG